MSFRPSYVPLNTNSTSGNTTYELFTVRKGNLHDAFSHLRHLYRGYITAYSKDKRRFMDMKIDGTKDNLIFTFKPADISVSAAAKFCQSQDHDLFQILSDNIFRTYTIQPIYTLPGLDLWVATTDASAHSTLFLSSSNCKKVKELKYIMYLQYKVNKSQIHSQYEICTQYPYTLAKYSQMLCEMKPEVASYAIHPSMCGVIFVHHFPDNVYLVVPCKTV